MTLSTRETTKNWNLFQIRYDRQQERKLFSSQTSHSTESPRRSPYAVLGLSNRHNRTEIPQDEIKSAFRRLAKVYHPDLNPDNLPLEECESLMSELVEAYERLTNKDEDDFLENIRVGSSNKVALACELYSVEELILDRFHEVYTLRIEYENEAEAEDTVSNEETHNEGAGEESLLSSLPQTASSITIPVQAHPGDSIMDLKERLESEFGTDWGLTNCLGWELLSVKRNNPTTSKAKSDGNNEDPATIANNNEVLSYHLFLDDYQIDHGDTIYAVVRKNDD